MSSLGPISAGVKWRDQISAQISADICADICRYLQISADICRYLHSIAHLCCCTRRWTCVVGVLTYYESGNN
jgi:hypothetical protein